uniref:Uncharacterized protein n=1 Tax=Plectus sambesii TaxID=2011161 RepID=A0A914WEE3_9BILA
MIIISVYIALAVSSFLQAANGAEADGGDGVQGRSAFSVDEYGQIVWNNPGISWVTPIHAVAVFHNAGGFRTGVASGNVTFRQANFPNYQATVIDIIINLPPSPTDRQYRLDILFAGELDEEYCSTGKRYYTIQDFTVKAGEVLYWTSLKVRDLSVTDEVGGLLGRTLRLACLSCRSYDGCAVIGRDDDEVYMEQPSPMNIRDLAP